MSQWIAVTDRLPPVGERVHCTATLEDVPRVNCAFWIGVARESDVAGSQEKGCVWMASVTIGDRDLCTHWMPLPGVEGLACHHCGDDATAKVNEKDDKPAAAVPSLESLILGLRNNERLSLLREYKTLVIEAEGFDVGSQRWQYRYSLMDSAIEHASYPLLVVKVAEVLARLRSVTGTENIDKPNQEKA